VKILRTIAFVTAAAVTFTLWKSAPAGAQESIEVSPDDARPAAPGPTETFTGEVSVKPLFNPNGLRNTGAAEVTFSPCARTAWHTHPGGQTLVVTSGTGWVQQWGGHKQQINPGDVIWTPPGVKHWHGAATAEAMTHVAIQDYIDGSPVDWMEHVTDDQYFS